MTRLLHIDDRDELRELVSVILQPRGYRVTGACNGEEGIEALGKADFDVILLDLEMPVLSGEFVIRWVAEHRPSLLSRIVVNSGGSIRRDLNEWISELGIAVMAKPFGIDELVHRLGQVASAPGAAGIAAFEHPSSVERLAEIA